jgi:hypothetical protein
MTFCTRFICGSVFSPLFLSRLFLVQFSTSLSYFICIFLLLVVLYFIFFWYIFVSFLVVPYFIIFWYLFVSFLGRVTLFSYGISFFLFLLSDTLLSSTISLFLFSVELVYCVFKEAWEWGKKTFCFAISVRYECLA